MRDHLKIAPLCFLLLLPLFVAATCTRLSTLDRLDQSIVTFTDFVDTTTAWADRNPEYVAAHPNIAEAVAKLRKELDGVPEPTEMLTRLHLLRDALVAGSANEGEVSEAIASSRAVLETIRLLTSPRP